MEKKKRRRPRAKKSIMPSVAEAVEVRSRVGDLVRVGLTVSVVVIAVALLALLSRQPAPSLSFSFITDTPMFARTAETGADKKTYERFTPVAGIPFTRAVGKPQLPVLYENVAIPCGAMGVHVVAATDVTNRETLANRISPVPKQTPRELPDGTTIVEPEFTVDEAFYGAAGTYPAERAVIVENANFRGLCYATVELRPYRYDPVQRILFRDDSLRVTVSWTNPESIVTPASLGKRFDRLVQGMGIRNLPEAIASKNTEQFGLNAATDGTVSLPSNLLVGQEPAPPHTDYLIVASNTLYDNESPALRQLAELRAQAANGGYDVSIVRISDILATTFPDQEQARTYTDQEKLKLFLRYAYMNWNGQNPPMEFVLLVGDGDGTSNETIPVYISLNGEMEPSPADFWYSASLNAAYPTYLQDEYSLSQTGSVMIGRLPVKTDAELQRAVDKIVQFETVAPSQPGAWRSQAGLASGFRSDSGFYVAWTRDTFFKNLRENSFVPHEAEVLEEYRSSYGDGMDDASRRQYHDALVASFQNGRIFQVTATHGSINTWSDGTAYQNVLSIADIPNLGNSDKPPIVIALACSTAAFDTTYTDSFGEAFLKSSASGSVAYIGATRLASLFSNPVLENIVSKMMNNQQTILGAAVLAGKNATPDLGLRMTYNYLGDPALDVGKVLQASTNYPDLTGTLASYSIAGRQVTARATLRNDGFQNAATIDLDLYAGDPESGGARLTPAPTVLSALDAGENVTADIVFTVPLGWNDETRVDLYLQIDGTDQIQEIHDDNNVGGPLAFAFYERQEQIVANGLAPSASGSSVVYDDTRGGDTDVFLFDRTSGQERRLSTNAAGQHDAALWGDTVVWQDDRNGNADVYSYDLAIGEERRLTTNFAEQLNPDVHGTTVVWEDLRNGNADVYSYDLASGRETRLTTSNAEQVAPAVFGSTVVWEDARNGNADVYQYDTQTGQEARMTDEPEDQGQPDVSDRGIVWADHRNGNYDIYYYDFASGEERQITSDLADQTSPAISGDLIVWLDGRNGNRELYGRMNGPDGKPGTADDLGDVRLTDNPSIRYRSSITLTGGTAFYSGFDGQNRVFRANVTDRLTPTATNRDGVLVGNNTSWTNYTAALGAKWVRVNHDLDGSPSPDLSTAKAYLDAGVNVVLTLSNRDANNIDDPNGEFSTYTGAGFPFPNTPEGKQRYQNDVNAVLAQLTPYLDTGRTIFVQAENEMIDASISTTSKYWRGTLPQYLTLLGVLAEKVRSISPFFKVVLSSFTNSSEELVIGPADSPKYQGAYDLLTAMLAATSDYDAADLHFYGCPDSIQAKVDWVLERMPADKLWISTENGGPMPDFCGYPAQDRYVNWDDPGELDAFESEQASQVSGRMTACAQNGGSICLWFSLFDQQGSVDEFSHLGLLEPDTPPREKPAYGAFQQYTVQNMNQPPTLNSVGNRAVIAGTTLTFSIAGADPDNNPITYRAMNLPAGATFAGQTFAWTPSMQQAGTFPNVHFSVTDGDLSDSEDITIAVTANQPPAFTLAKAQKANEGDTLTFSVLANDPDGDTLTYSAANLPAGASFSGSAFTWRTSGQSAGSYLVHFSASDGQYEDTQDVSLSVSDITSPTIAAVDPITAASGSAVSFSVNAADDDKDTLAVSATNLPIGSSFIDRKFTWTPAENQTGTFTVRFTATDFFTTTSRDVLITVQAATPPNNTNAPSNTNTASPDDQLPIINAPESQTIVAGTAFAMPVSVTDGNQADVVLSAANLPEGATFLDNHDGTGVIRWTPSAQQAGSYIVTIIAVSGAGTSTQDVALLVTSAAGGEPFPLSKNFTAFPKLFHSGFTVAAGNAWGDPREEIIIGTGTETMNMVRVYSNDGTLLSSFTPFSKSFTGGVRVAACDLNADGVDEILAAPGAGYKPYIRIFNAQGRQVLKKQIWALDGGAMNGLNIACADLNDDGVAEIVAASDAGAGRITLHRPKGSRIASFWPFGRSYRGGLTVTALNTPSGVRILAAKIQGGEFRVLTFRGKRVGPGYAPFGKNFSGGLALAAGDVNSDGAQEVLVTPLSKLKPRVRVFTNDFRMLISQFYAYPTTFTGGVRAAVGDVNGDGAQDIITVPASKRKADVLQFDWQGKSIAQ